MSRDLLAVISNFKDVYHFPLLRKLSAVTLDKR